MRVLWIIDSLGSGGAENLMVPLLNTLKNLIVESRVCVLNTREGNPIAAKLSEIGIQVDLMEINNLRKITDLWKLIQYIQKYRPDVIHTQLEASDILGNIAAKLVGIPSISTLHTIDIPTKGVRKNLRNFLRWACLKHLAKRVIVVSDVTRQYYIKLGFKNSQLVTIYNGIDLRKFYNKDNSLLTKERVLGLSGKSILLTTVAVLREPKGIQYMLRAMPRLLENIPNLFYGVVGDGAYRESLEALTKSLGLKDHVLFLNQRTDVQKILSVSDLFVYPTLLDALPTAVLEAMAVGVPIVATDIYGLPEILKDQETGLLVPPKDPALLAEAILLLLNDRVYANKLAKGASKSVIQRFDIHSQASNLLILYGQIVADGRSH